MKELSIEQKAKAYDEAIKRANELNYVSDKDSLQRKTVEHIFPELKESEDEDEKIRKELISFIRRQIECHDKPNVERDEKFESWVTWLEKPSEQKETLCDKCKKAQPSHSCQDITALGRCAVEHEQKPAWSEEDEDVIGMAIIALEDMYDPDEPNKTYAGYTIPFNKAALRLRVLRERVLPKIEWSEEDERLFQIVIDILDRQNHSGNISRTDLIACVRKLKSLRPKNNITDEELAQAKKNAYNDALDKIEYHSGEPTFDDGWSAAIWYLKKRNTMPQSQWKPSKEQISVLEQWLKNKQYDGDSRYAYPFFQSLYEQLKQL